MVQNIIIGSVSALLSGFLARALGLYGPGDVASIVFVLLGTIIILVIVNSFDFARKGLLVGAFLREGLLTRGHRSRLQAGCVLGRL